MTTELQHTKHLHITDNTMLWYTFLFYEMGGGGVKILWYNILTPPPHLVKFDETILEYWLCVFMINQA